MHDHWTLIYTRALGSTTRVGKAGDTVKHGPAKSLVAQATTFASGKGPVLHGFGDALGVRRIPVISSPGPIRRRRHLPVDDFRIWSRAVTACRMRRSLGQVTAARSGFAAT